MPHKPQVVGSCLDNAKRSAVREGMLDSVRTAPRNYDGASKPLSLTAGSNKNVNDYTCGLERIPALQRPGPVMDKTPPTIP